MSSEMTAAVYVVTGGNRGIGRAVVERLADAGLRVAFTYRDRDAAEEVLGACGELASAHYLDVADRSAVKPLVRGIEESIGPIVGLVNNAGISHSRLLAMTSDDEWDRVLDVNLGAVFRLCRAAVPYMVRRRRGSIVNVASLSAVRGVGGQSVYAASKAGVLALTRVLAREVGRRGIRVNAVVPGYVETEMTAELPETARDALRASEALSTGVDVEAVASCVHFLLGSEAAAITGQCLPVDAGASI